jgi:hypothetical protein
MTRPITHRLSAKQAELKVIGHIEREWPDISDKANCARWILRREDHTELDQLCCFWQRHEAD